MKRLLCWLLGHKEKRRVTSNDAGVHIYNRECKRCGRKRFAKPRKTTPKETA